MALARPTSSTFTIPSARTLMLAGFKSRRRPLAETANLDGWWDNRQVAENGREILYYEPGSSRLQSVPLTYRGDAVEIGAVKPLFKVQPMWNGPCCRRREPNGQRFLVNTLSDGTSRRRSRWSSTGGRGPAADGPRDDWSFGGRGRSLRADEQAPDRVLTGAARLGSTKRLCPNFVYIFRTGLGRLAREPLIRADTRAAPRGHRQPVGFRT